MILSDSLSCNVSLDIQYRDVPFGLGGVTLRFARAAATSDLESKKCKSATKGVTVQLFRQSTRMRPKCSLGMSAHPGFAES